MSAAYRMGLAPSLPADRSDIDGARWSLVGHDPSTPMRSGAFAASDGQTVPYRLWPSKNRRALVLLLHGALDYSGAFDELGPQLANHGLSALAIDQRGFGATSTRGKWGGHNRMIRDVIEAVLFLRMRYGCDLPLFVLGESMGAAVAVHSAARVPDLDLAGLILASPGAVSGLWRRIVGSLLTRIFNFCLPNGGFRIERVSAWDHAPSAAIRLLSDPMVLRQIRPATLLGLLKLSLSAIDEAERVRVPVLTMAGGRDDVLRLDCIRRLHDGLAGEKQWAYFLNAPHLLLHWKDNDRVVRLVLGWVDDRLNRAGGLSPAAS
jgi:acylglycerol lipase